jgi:uncharacterized RDD family membrane protein YckC
MTDSITEAYVRDVLDHLPRAVPGRARIEADLRLHIAEMMAEGAPEATAVERMGPPQEVAAAFLAQFPLVPAPHGRRFVAFLVDVAVVIAPFVPLVWLSLAWGDQHPGVPVLALLSIIPGILGIAYFPVMEALWGQTLGKRLVGICVVREDGSRARWGPALLRRLPFFMNFFPIDALFVYFTERRQRAFDKVAGTLVVACR